MGLVSCTYSLYHYNAHSAALHYLQMAKGHAKSDVEEGAAEWAGEDGDRMTKGPNHTE
jgi:hypothetical protein